MEFDTTAARRHGTAIASVH